MTKRDDLIAAFNDSAAMEGNEPHFLKRLEEYESELASIILNADDAVDAIQQIEAKFGVTL